MNIKEPIEIGKHLIDYSGAQINDQYSLYIQAHSVNSTHYKGVAMHVFCQ